MAINVNAQGQPWTVSGGGPIVVVPAELAAQWYGVNAKPGDVVPPGWTWGSAGGPICDYDRACDPPTREGTPYGGFGWVDIADTPVLILDAEIPTYFVPSSNGGYLVRNSIDDADVDPSTIAEGDWRTIGADTIVLGDGRMFMFDSAFTGASDPEAITAHDGVGVITLGAGTWRVAFATNAAEVDFVRFTRA